jgi:hypothetical protein
MEVELAHMNCLIDEAVDSMQSWWAESLAYQEEIANLNFHIEDDRDDDGHRVIEHVWEEPDRRLELEIEMEEKQELVRVLEQNIAAMYDDMLNTLDEYSAAIQRAREELHQAYML